MWCKLLKKAGETETCLQNNLGKVFFKTPKYHENRIVDYQKAKENINMEIRSCILSWCDKLGVTTSSSSEWKQAAISVID